MNNQIIEQTNEIIKEIDNSKYRILEATKKTEDRGTFKTFLIGSDYKNLGVIQSELEKSKEIAVELIKVADSTTDFAIKEELKMKSEAITIEASNLENFVKERESKFSLFGWFIKLFQ